MATMKDRRNILIITMAVFIMGVGLPSVSSAADVSVECAYRNDGDLPGTPADLECHIYVNTDGVSLISGGVKLLYDTDKLATPTVTKNDSDWYFGAGGPDHPYMDPDDTNLGEVIYIVGKLDTNDDPQVGVNGSRVLIGTATFTRKTDEILSGKQDAFFGISSDLGRTTASFVNFVDTAGDPLDAPGNTNFLAPVVTERGDANADGTINSVDYIRVRNLRNSTDFPPYVDCNYDGAVNSVDYICVRNKRY
jgi:hypothetical protein